MAELYNFQKTTIKRLAEPGKHICCATMGSGKTAIALHWARQTRKKRWLIVTTASARDSLQWVKEYVMWFNIPPEQSLSSFTVISWQGLAKWVLANWSSLEDYCFILDEVAKMRAGVSSQRGRAALQIAKRTDCWAGFTATPGDRWIDFYAYFVATGKVKNKTEFRRQFCDEQTFKGFPEIVGYHHEDVLQRWWEEISVAPDTHQMLEELPPEQHHVITFADSADYRTIAKTHTLEDGTFLETTGAVCAELRRRCFTKQKKQWVVDYLENLGTNAVLFYQYRATGDELEAIAYKALPKEAKVWRIRGGQHDIPTVDTIGKYDIVLCQWEAAAEGLNLQFMNQWVSVESTYAYSTAEQARGRIKRIGQQHDKMEFWYLKCKKTIEDQIYEALRNKSEFSESTWITQNNLIKEFK